MQNTFPTFTDTQGYVKIGRCTSTGNIVFLPETKDRLQDKHSSCFINDTTYEYLHFDPFFLFNELLSDEELQNILFKLPECYGYIPEDYFPNISFLVQLIFTEFNNKESHYDDSVRGLLLSFISLITRRKQNKNPAGRDDSLIQTALLYIHNNYSGKLSIVDIAIHCNISESHFRRKFTEIMHIAPLDYINSLRIHKACQLIYHSEMHINEIAQSVGFVTLSSFNRQFQALLGTSPTKWRQKNTGPMSQIHYTGAGTH